MKYAPIVLFTYNRLSHTKSTVEHLQKNELAKESDLFIFSDGPKTEKDESSVKQVRNYLNKVDGFKTITKIFHSSNKGLANSIIKGVSEILQNHNTVIVLEDDLSAGVNFLSYMNAALGFYNPNTIWCISGYNHDMKIPSNYKYDTYLAYRSCSWGWATWKQNWEKTDWDVKEFNSFIRNKDLQKKFNRGGNDVSVMLLKQQQAKIHSWAIRFNYASFKNNLPTVYPCYSFINNIGTDGTGTNMRKSNKYTSNYKKINTIESFCPDDLIDAEIQKRFKSFYDTSIQRKIINWYKIKTATICRKD